MKKRRDFQGLGDLIHRFAKDETISEQLVTATLPEIWLSAVGEKIHEVSTITKFEKGVVWVTVSIPVWRVEILARRTEIILRINTLAGRDIVRDIEVR